jgi:hypothetical protein
MEHEPSPIDADNGFFKALIAADIDTLDGSVSHDFVLVGVLNGAEIGKSILIEALRSGLLKFVSIEPAEQRARRYGETAIVNGRTSMTCCFGESEISVPSRYTHVFFLRDNRWILVSAQGTPIVEAQ